MMDRIFAIKAG